MQSARSLSALAATASQTRTLRDASNHAKATLALAPVEWVAKGFVTSLQRRSEAYVGTEAHDEIARRRTEATQAIVGSDADKKLIVAGPGTGKTFTFRQALEACGDRGLALTFIRNLVADLRQALEDIADVFTFHGFCKHRLHRHPTDLLDEGWHYYPPLLELIAHDLSLIGRSWTKVDIERALKDPARHGCGGMAAPAHPQRRRTGHRRIRGVRTIFALTGAIRTPRPTGRTALGCGPTVSPSARPGCAAVRVS